MLHMISSGLGNMFLVLGSHVGFRTVAPDRSAVDDFVGGLATPGGGIVCT